MIRDAVENLVQDHFFQEISTYRKRGLDSDADFLESILRDILDWASTYDLQRLTLADAEDESGYSYATLRRHLDDGTIPNAGRAGSPRILRRHLPRKPGHQVEDAGPLIELYEPMEFLQKLVS